MNIKIKKTAMVIAMSLMLVQQAQSAVPVVDFGAIAQAITQVQNQVQQIRQMNDQIRAITDNGNFADLLKDPNLRKQLNQYLPKGYTDIMQAVHRGDARALQGIYQQVLIDEQNRQKGMTGAERVKMTSAMTEAQMIGMMKTLDIRSQSVNNLINQINHTANMAQKQDLMNTLQAEQAMINVDMNRMQVMIKMAEHQQKLADQQAVAEYRKKTNK